MGLMSFYYASIHVCVYLTLELDLDIEELLYDIETRHHIIFGLAAWLLLLLLAITSITFIIKKMGKWWRRTHRMIYILGIAAVTHIFLASKATDSSPWIYIYLLSIFLLHRLFVIAIKKLRRKDDTGLEHFR